MAIKYLSKDSLQYLIGLIKTKFSTKADKATTLSGYGITDALSSSTKYAASSSVGGAASSATALATARTIGIDTGASGTATSFDGSKNITIPITSVKEAYLSWGGKNYSGSHGPIDAAMVPELGANRLAFMSASAVTVEYSRDSGATWTDYEATDDQKKALFDGNGTGFVIGKASSGSTSTIATKDYQLRISVLTSTANVYTALNKFVIYLSTSGTGSNWCTIRARLQSNYESGTDTWSTFADKVGVAGWSGYNVINTPTMTTYGNTKASQYGQIQFIFGCDTGSTDSRYAGLAVYKIFGFGGVGWNTPSTMAKYGRIYTYDNSQNVTFPAGVKATSFTENGTALSSKYSPIAGSSSLTTCNKGSFGTAAVATVETTGISSDTTTLATTAQVKSFVEGKGYTTNTGTITAVQVAGTSIATSGTANITLATGDSNGQVKIGGTNVSVKGLGSNAYTSTTIPTKVSQLTNDSGYTTNTGTVTGVKVGTTSYSPSSGIVTIPAYPTTLPASDVSSWAKASTKPTYTAAEVGLEAATISDITNIFNGTRS